MVTLVIKTFDFEVCTQTCGEKPKYIYTQIYLNFKVEKSKCVLTIYLKQYYY